MINEDEALLICDLAETYHIYNYRLLPPTLVATLTTGLRDNSRLVQKACGVKTTQTNMVLATIADEVGFIIRCLTGDKVVPNSMIDAINGVEQTNPSKVKAFESGEDFAAYWEEANRG